MPSRDHLAEVKDKNVELKREIRGGVVAVIIVQISIYMPRWNGSGLFFFILIEIWDPGLTIREVRRRKIHIGP